VLRRGLRATCALLATAVVGTLGVVVPQPASASTYALVQGSGSSSAANLLNQWAAVTATDGIRVVYTASGSMQGRHDYATGTTDFGVSDLPYAGGADASARPYAYVPLVATGVAFAYNLVVGERRVVGLRFSGETLARIFTGQITSWDDPAIRADNNGRILPATPITPVVRADGTGDTQVFTDYLGTQFPSIWGPCNGGSTAATAYFPLHCGKSTGSDVAMSGADGVMNWLRSTYNGSIGYVGNGYAVAANLPVAGVENAAGYFVRPSSYGVSVGLGDAGDPRAYPLSHYESAIVPTSSSDPRITTAKRQTLVDFLSYAVCEGQTYAGPLGYGPLPRDLVADAFTEIAKVAADDDGVDLRDPSTCGTPDYDEIAPPPEACQQRAAGPCGTGGPPTNRRAPAVAGAVRVGATVEASAGAWDGADRFTYRWLADGAVVASGLRYRIPASLLGRSLSVEVTGLADDFPSRTVTSGGVLVAPGRLAGSGLEIAGRPLVGRTLAVRGARIAGAQLRVQWYAAGRKIPGARSLRWTLRRAQVGKRVTVRVVASATAYESLVRTSPRTTKIRRR